MKKFWLLSLWLFILCFAWNLTQANSEYEYTNLNITADILTDWTINVKEDFTADFFVEKHGIIRTIPLNYSVEGKIFHIKVSIINVKWKKFKSSETIEEREIKIWKANKIVKWIQEYPISYRVSWLIRNFSGKGYAELYWNLVWYDFDTNINHVKAEIHLPKPYTWFTADDFLITTDWLTTSVEEFQWSIDWSQWDKITIIYDQWLPAHHGITLSIKFPNDYFKFNHKKQQSLIWAYKKWNSIFSTSLLKHMFERVEGILNIFLIILILIFAICPPIAFRLIRWLLYYLVLFLFNIFNSIKLWIKRIRSKIIRKKGGQLRWELAKKFPVIVQYNPPKGISSAEASLLIHRHAEAIALVSLIYKWAIEWLISIKSEFKKDINWNDNKKIDSITIKKLWEISESAPDYEKKFFKYFKSTQTISSNKDIVISLEKLKALETYWKQKKWFSPNLTESWAKILAQVLWYRKFLQNCDENQIRTFLKEDPLFINKALPYATIFGIESKLIKKILPIINELNINFNWYKWDLSSMNDFVWSIHDYTPSTPSKKTEPDFLKPWKLFSSGGTSYSSSGWHSGWSSFGRSWGWWGGWGFSSWWGGWWGGWRSW